MTATDAVRPYAGGRLIYDADAHIVEPPSWLRDHADPKVRDRIPLLWTKEDVPHLIRDAGVDPDAVEDVWSELGRVHASPAFRRKALENVMIQKQLNAFGAFLPDDRRTALDHMGFAQQLVINTFSNGALQAAEAEGDLEIVREMARAHNRAIAEFCSSDPRMLPAGYVPISDREEAETIASEAINLGCRALIIASAPPPHSPTHVDLDGLWARAAEAGTPVLLHVGGTGEVLDPAYLNSGRPDTPSFHGGEGPMMSLRVIALPNPARALLAAMVYDGVLMHHPELKIGVYELGASWLPSFIREIDAVAAGFKNEPRIKRLERRPSEYILNQVRVTPFPYEDVGWIIAQSSERSCLFCSDYPHFEGGRDPLRRFDQSLAGNTEEARKAFYSGNFIDFVRGDVPTQARP